MIKECIVFLNIYLIYFKYIIFNIFEFFLLTNFHINIKYIIKFGELILNFFINYIKDNARDLSIQNLY